MRRIALTVSLVASLSSSRLISQNDGKIPITTRSAQARSLFLEARHLNETLKAHDAHALFERAVAADPSFAMGEYSLAATAPTPKDLAEHLHRALTLADAASRGERLMILGMQARVNANPTLNRQLAESLVALYPRDERAHFVLGTAYFARQLFDKSAGEYEKAIAINPDYSLAYNQLGYSYRSANRMAEAESAFRRYIALVPNDPNPYDSYAELLMKTGRFDESIAQYTKAHSIDPHFGGSFVGIASDHMYAGRYDAAVAEAERYFAAARDDGERHTALATLAMIHVDHGATDRAVQTLERSYAAASASGDTAGMSADEIVLGDILLEVGRVDAAADRYRQGHTLVASAGLSYEIHGDDALAAHYDMARVALARHDLPAARTEAAAYLAGSVTRKNDARVRQAHELNGLVALQAREYSASLAELAQADQENPAVLYAMSRAAAGTGQKDKAKELNARAGGMNILPTFPYVFTRAAIAAATRSATSGSGRGTQR